MIAIVSGILFGIVILAVFWKRPAALSWGALLLGLAAAALFLGAMLFEGQGNFGLNFFPLSLVFSFAGVIIGLGALGKIRNWALWVGLAAALAVAGFWVWFSLAEILM